MDNRRIITKKYSLLMAAVIAGVALPLSVSAAKLASGTLLTMNPGVVTNNTCISGSCFGMEVVKGFPVWTALLPGTDGGIILGKNQTGGGQELGQDSVSNAASGQIVQAFNFFGSYGTFGTAPLTSTLGGVVTSSSLLNYFDSASCAGAACTGLTELGTWNVSWGGMAAPMGSDGGCLSLVCSAAQLSGIFISKPGRLRSR